MADLKQCVLRPTDIRQGAGNDGSTHTLVAGSSTSAIYRDEKGGQIVLKGTGFKYQGDVAVGGTVTAATFKDKSGATFLAWEA